MSTVKPRTSTEMRYPDMMTTSQMIEKLKDHEGNTHMADVSIKYGWSGHYIMRSGDLLDHSMDGDGWDEDMPIPAFMDLYPDSLGTIWRLWYP